MLSPIVSRASLFFHQIQSRIGGVFWRSARLRPRPSLAEASNSTSSIASPSPQRARASFVRLAPLRAFSSRFMRCVTGRDFGSTPAIASLQSSIRSPYQRSLGPWGVRGQPLGEAPGRVRSCLSPSREVRVAASPFRSKGPPALPVTVPNGLRLISPGARFRHVGDSRSIAGQPSWWSQCVEIRSLLSQPVCGLHRLGCGKAPEFLFGDRSAKRCQGQQSGAGWISVADGVLKTGGLTDHPVAGNTGPNASF